MKKSSYVLSVMVTFLVAFAAGYYVCKRSIEQNNIVIGNKFNSLYEPFNNEALLDSAHKMSVQFHESRQWCNSPGTQWRSNYFDIKYSTLQDLIRAVEMIKRRHTGVDTFRTIFLEMRTPSSNPNVSDTSARMLVVGLNNNLTEMVTTAALIDGGLDCPINCDYANSRIVTGNLNRGENECVYIPTR